MMNLFTVAFTKMVLGTTILSTFGTGRTARLNFEDGNYWSKTVIAESRETGFSASLIDQSWDGTHLRVWMPDDVSEPTLDMVIG